MVFEPSLFHMLLCRRSTFLRLYLIKNPHLFVFFVTMERFPKSCLELNVFAKDVTCGIVSALICIIIKHHHQHLAPTTPTYNHVTSLV